MVLVLKNQLLYDRGVELLESLFYQQLQAQGMSRTHLLLQTDVDVNEPESIRLQLGNCCLYLYDFRKGTDVRERYQRSIEITQRVSSLTGHVERVRTIGTLSDRTTRQEVIGWYLTQSPI